MIGNLKLKIIRIKFYLKSFFQKKSSSQYVHNKDWLNYNKIYNIDKEKAISLAKEEDKFIWQSNKINSKEYFNEISKMLSKEIKQHSLIDLGSGAGRFIFYSIDKFKKIISVEPSIEGYNFQKKVFKEYPNFEIYNNYAEDFLNNFETDEDIVLYANAVLIHLKNDAVDIILKKINNLKKGTVIILDESYTIDGTFNQYWMGYMRPKEYYIKSLDKYVLTFFDYYDDDVSVDINHNIRGAFVGVKIK